MSHRGSGIGINIPDNSFGFQQPQFGGGGGGMGGLGLQDAGAFAFNPAFGAANIGLKLLGNLFGGDGGQRKRIRETQGVGRDLFNTPAFDSAGINQQRGAFQRGILSPFLNKFAQGISGRVGLGSGIGQNALLNKAGDLSAAFESQAIQSALDRALRSRLAGARILQSLAR